MEKCSNQADLDELTSTLISVINNCPPGKEIYKGMGEERRSEAQIQQLSKESKNSERNGQRERAIDIRIGKQGNSFRGTEIGNREQLEAGDGTRTIHRTVKTGTDRVSIKNKARAE